MAGEKRRLAGELADALAAAGLEAEMAVQTGAREAWAAVRLPDGVLVPALVRPGGVQLPGDGLDRLDCPAELLDVATNLADASSPAGQWLAKAKDERRRSEAFAQAACWFFPDGVLTEHGAVHWLKPALGRPGPEAGAWQGEPEYDVCTKLPDRRLNVMMTREAAEERGCIPLHTWRRPIWDAVSSAVAVLDYRRCSLDRPEMPAVTSNVDLLFNGDGVRRTCGGFKAGARWAEECRAPRVELSCGNLAAVWESGMRGRLVCGGLLKIVELVRSPKTGRDIARVRYPLSFDGRCPWAEAYLAACAKADEDAEREAEAAG